VVAKVSCEFEHHNTLTSASPRKGPVALLPDGERGYALVWTADPATAEALCALDGRNF